MFYRTIKIIRNIIGSENYIKLRIEIEKTRQRIRNVKNDEIDIFLNKYSKTKAGINFIQIGSNDGVFGDPIYKYIIRNQWQGILVEPNPLVFDLLCFTYRNRKLLQFENCAIGIEDCVSDFFTTPKDEFWSHYGSTQRSSLIPQSGFEKIKVPTMSFSSLMNKYNLKTIQLIHTDTEGYDFQIIKQIDFDKYKIEVVLFEHIHLRNDLDTCYHYLRQNGFDLIVGLTDTLAYRTI